MKENESILESLAMLKAAYPRQELADETIDVYTLALRDIEPKLLKTAILRLITKTVFFPTIAEIRNTATDLVLEQQGKLTPMQAWHAANRGDARDLPEEVKEAVYQACGDFWTLRRSTTQAADRKRFIDAYTEIINKLRQETTDLPVVQEYIALGDGETRRAMKQLAEQLTMTEDSS